MQLQITTREKVMELRGSRFEPIFMLSTLNAGMKKKKFNQVIYPTFFFKTSDHVISVDMMN